MQVVKKLLIPFVAICLSITLAYHWPSKPIAPEVTFTTIEGKKISMASLKGKVVLVSFWATDCPSCNKEMPDLINTYNAYKSKNFEVIAVAMSYDPPAQVVNYVTQKHLPFPVMHDGYGSISNSFGNIEATPTTYIFDKQGTQLARTIGILNFRQLHAMLDREL
jgi:peroxiredoxin